MSEFPNERRETEARVRTARWSPWVWVVPALAIFFVGWLVVRYGFFGGGDVTVRFVEARGLDRYSPVRFRGAKVGTVQKITIGEDLKDVVVRITLDASMSHALKKGTKFWIVEPGLEGGGLGGILSGTYVGISPGDGEDTREFVGQEYPPIMNAPEAGKTFILEAKGVGSIAAGTPVQFEGMRVGRVLGAAFNEQRRITEVHVFIVQRFVNHVRQSTRFWRGGGLQVSLGGGGLSLAGGASLTSLLSAPVNFYTPEHLSGEVAADNTRYELFDTEAAAIAAADGPHLNYMTYFPGPVQGLTAGTPVRMKGIQVGRVREVRLRYVPASASLETPVMLEIDPRLLEISGATRADLRAAMNDALSKLVRKGMRATLATSLVLPGASGVLLETVAKPGTARLVLENDPPIIPAGTSGDGIGAAMGAITDVANRIKAIPIEEIAGNLRTTSQRLNALVNDPVLDASLRRLDTSLAAIEKASVTVGNNAAPITESLKNAADSAEAAAKTVEQIAGKANQNVDPIITSLRNAASSAEQAAARAQQLIGTSQKQGYDISELVRELTRAAESVRALANYLTENPDALIRGRRE